MAGSSQLVDSERFTIELSTEDEEPTTNVMLIIGIALLVLYFILREV